MFVPWTLGCFILWLTASNFQGVLSIPPPVSLSIANGTSASVDPHSGQGQAVCDTTYYRSSHAQLLAQVHLESLRRDCLIVRDLLKRSPDAWGRRLFDTNERGSIILSLVRSHGRCQARLENQNLSAGRGVSYHEIGEAVDEIINDCLVVKDHAVGNGGYKEIIRGSRYYVILSQLDWLSDADVAPINDTQQQQVQPHLNVAEQQEQFTQPALVNRADNPAVPGMPKFIHCQETSAMPRPKKEDCHLVIDHMLRSHAGEIFKPMTWSREIDFDHGIPLPASFIHGTCEIFISDGRRQPPIRDKLSIMYVALRANSVKEWCLGRGPPLPSGVDGVGGRAALGEKGLYLTISGILDGVIATPGQAGKRSEIADIQAPVTQRSLPSKPTSQLTADINISTTLTTLSIPPYCYHSSADLTISPNKDDCYMAISHLIGHTQDMYPQTWSTARSLAANQKRPFRVRYATCEVSFGPEHRGPAARFSLLKVIDLAGEVVEHCVGGDGARGGAIGMGGYLSGWYVQVVGANNPKPPTPRPSPPRPQPSPAPLPPSRPQPPHPEISPVLEGRLTNVEESVGGSENDTNMDVTASSTTLFISGANATSSSSSGNPFRAGGEAGIPQLTPLHSLRSFSRRRWPINNDDKNKTINPHNSLPSSPTAIPTIDNESPSPLLFNQSLILT